MNAKPFNAATGVILAGGLSRRMFADVATGHATGDPRDKGLLALGNTTMLGRVIACIKPQLDTLVLNANGDPARFSEFGLPVVPDPIDGFVGPLAGVLAGLQWAKSHTPAATHVISVSSDAPFLPADLVTSLAGKAIQHPTGIVLARSKGDYHPVIGCWPVAHAADLELELRAGIRKVLRWTDKHGTHGVDFKPHKIGGKEVDPFFNANTPEDFAEAQRLIDLERGGS